MQQAELKLDRSLCGQLENCAQRRSAKLLLLCGTCSEVDNAQREELKGGEREERGGTDRLETAKRVKRGGIGGIVEDLKVDERVLNGLSVGLQGAHRKHLATVLGITALIVGHSLQLFVFVDILNEKKELQKYDYFDLNSVVLATKGRRR